MNRVPRRDSSRKQTEYLERRVNMLTGLVVVQIVLLLVLMIAQFAPVLSEKFGGDGVNDAIASNDDDQNISEDQESVVEPVIQTEETGDLPPEIAANRPVRVEILNGCGIGGLASKFADLLRSKGYDVRDTRNADNHDYANTLIYDRTSLTGQSAHLADLLGMTADKIRVRPNPQLVDIDITIVLGKDHSTLKLQP
jgi:LytR cell envelope-related transcriptional attenuator